VLPFWRHGNANASNGSTHYIQLPTVLPGTHMDSITEFFELYTQLQGAL